LIFFLYALVSVTLFFLSVVYAFLACFCYIASLGGFRFHLFLSEAQDLNTQANGKYRNWIPLVFVVCSCTLLLLIPLLQTMWYYFVDLPLIQNQPLSDYKFSYILTSMASTFQYYFVRKIGFFTFFSALYSLIVFVPFPKNNTNN